MNSTPMFRSQVAQVASMVRNDKETTLELYSHADTYVLGGGALEVAGKARQESPE